MALALSASQGSGIMANFGTMTKPFHAGRSAHSGLVSARLAELGFTAAPTRSNTRRASCARCRRKDAVDRESPTQRLGEEWQILKQGLGIKKYPACYCTHRALDAMLELLASHPLKPAEIERITVSISNTHSLILRNHEPQTGLDAKFSMEFAMAAAVISRRASLAEYTDGFVRRPEVQELMRRVSARDQRELRSRRFRGASVFDQVRVELVGGERSRARKWRAPRAMPTGRLARTNCSTSSASASTPAAPGSRPTCCSTGCGIWRICRRAN